MWGCVCGREEFKCMYVILYVCTRSKYGSGSYARTPTRPPARAAREHPRRAPGRGAGPQGRDATGARGTGRGGAGRATGGVDVGLERVGARGERGLRRAAREPEHHLHIARARTSALVLFGLVTDISLGPFGLVNFSVRGSGGAPHRPRGRARAGGGAGWGGALKKWVGTWVPGGFPRTWCCM